MPKLKVTLGIGYPTATREDVIEIDETEWSGCDTDEQREYLINSYWVNWSNSYINGGAEIIE